MKQQWMSTRPAASISFILVLWILTIGLMGISAAQPHQSQAAYVTAIDTKSSSPDVIRVTVVDDRTGQTSTGCIIAPWLLGAIYIEK
jgi:hypothetical protein